MAALPANEKVYSFKAVGEKLKDWREQRRLDETTSFPIGIKTPLELGVGKSGLFEMHYSLKGVIADNLRNLILTNHGERLGMYDFGANLQELCMELGQEDADNEAIMRISRAVKKYMSFVELDTFETVLLPEYSSSGLAARAIRVKYRVPSARLSAQAIEVILFSAG
tara:strand:+ start:206 stop:706 length:501 start_codon:yes stop_codon:yes gene_type:complete